MSVMETFDKVVDHLGTAIERSIDTSWNVAVGNTRMKKRGLEQFDPQGQEVCIGLGAVLGMVSGTACAWYTGNTAWLLMMLSGIPVLNLISLREAYKYDSQFGTLDQRNLLQLKDKPPAPGNP